MNNVPPRPSRVDQGCVWLLREQCCHLSSGVNTGFGHFSVEIGRVIALRCDSSFNSTETWPCDQYPRTPIVDSEQEAIAIEVGLLGPATGMEFVRWYSCLGPFFEFIEKLCDFGLNVLWA